MPVTVMRVRPVAVDVLGLLVDVFVNVGLTDLALVRVDVVKVAMIVSVGMDQPFMPVGMDVPLAGDFVLGRWRRRPARRRRDHGLFVPPVL